MSSNNPTGKNQYTDKGGAKKRNAPKGFYKDSFGNIRPNRHKDPIVKVKKVVDMVGFLNRK